ncbi:hypothetical protein TMatcc_003026 [Talaromyces marneffei ATCC 18224]
MAFRIRVRSINKQRLLNPYRCLCKYRWRIDRSRQGLACTEVFLLGADRSFVHLSFFPYIFTASSTSGRIFCTTLSIHPAVRVYASSPSGEYHALRLLVILLRLRRVRLSPGPSLARPTSTKTQELQDSSIPTSIR